jgi:hypothetical protein
MQWLALWLWASGPAGADRAEPTALQYRPGSGLESPLDMTLWVPLVLRIHGSSRLPWWKMDSPARVMLHWYDINH